MKVVHVVLVVVIAKTKTMRPGDPESIVCEPIRNTRIHLSVHTRLYLVVARSDRDWALVQWVQWAGVSIKQQLHHRWRIQMI